MSLAVMIVPYSSLWTLPLPLTYHISCCVNCYYKYSSEKLDKSPYRLPQKKNIPNQDSKTVEEIDQSDFCYYFYFSLVHMVRIVYMEQNRPIKNK